MDVKIINTPNNIISNLSYIKKNILRSLIRLEDFTSYDSEAQSKILIEFLSNLNASKSEIETIERRLGIEIKVDVND